MREKSLENAVHNVMASAFGKEHVIKTRNIGSSLGLGSRLFPATAQPDIVAYQDNHFHICELKSSRTDYSRFDCVFESKPFRAYLQALGYDGKNPWEVEQDLIKLHLYKKLAANVGSCLFVMVDAYAGGGRSWTKVFESKQNFMETMRTELVKGLADTIFDRTTIREIQSEGAKARLIIIEMHPWIR